MYRPRPPMPAQMPSSDAKRSGATNRHCRRINQPIAPLPTRVSDAKGKVNTESYSNTNSRIITVVPRQHARNTPAFLSRRKIGCSNFMAASVPSARGEWRGAKRVKMQKGASLPRPLQAAGYGSMPSYTFRNLRSILTSGWTRSNCFSTPFSGNRMSRL
jgi:hypothetical protein